MSAERLALVFAGGEPSTAAALDGVDHAAWVVAADSGLDHARRLGARVDLVIGDLDSVTPAGLDAAIAEGVEVDRHPVAKDRTDLTLTLDAAHDRGAERIVVIGGHGGRLDHLLANALLLASDDYAGVAVEARMGAARLWVVRRSATVPGTPGDVVTLLPVHGPAHGVRTEGLRFPLRGETLEPGTSRGVSNELTATAASATLTQGILLIVKI